MFTEKGHLTFTEEDRAAIRTAKANGQTLLCPECRGDGCPSCFATGVSICKRYCPDCKSADHHWLPDFDMATGEPVMACKHCSAQREYVDADDEL